MANSAVGKKVKYEQFQTIPSGEQYKGWLENNITIAKCELFNGIKTSYIIYDKDKMILGYVSKEGKLHFTKEYVDRIKEQSGDYYKQLGLEEREIYLNELPTLQEFVTSSDKKLEPEELEKLQGQYNKKEETEKEKDEKEQEDNIKSPKQVDEENKKIEEDLGLEENQIIFSADIKDKEFYDRVAVLRNTNKPAKLIYTKDGKAMLVSESRKQKGKYEQIAGISEPKTTNRRALNVGREGDLFKEEIIMGEFEIAGYEREYSLGWVIGQGGYPELRELRYEETTDPMANIKLLAAPVETRTEKPVTKRVRDIINHNVNKDISEEIDKYEKLQQENKEDIEVTDIEDGSKTQEEDDERIRTLFDDPRSKH